MCFATTLPQIIPGVVKDAVFRKGHVVTEEDVPVLLSVGKEHLYVWEKQEGMLHEMMRQRCCARFARRAYECIWRRKKERSN